MHRLSDICKAVFSWWHLSLGLNHHGRACFLTLTSRNRKYLWMTVFTATTTDGTVSVCCLGLGKHFTATGIFTDLQRYDREPLRRRQHLAKYHSDEWLSYLPTYRCLRILDPHAKLPTCTCCDCGLLMMNSARGEWAGLRYVLPTINV